MEGKISLKEFIHGVKRELLEASESVETPAAFEMTEVELEAEFVLDVSAKVEGSLAFFVKIEGGASASQSHKVRIKMTPLKQQAAVGFTSETTTPQDWSVTTSAISTAHLGDHAIILPIRGFPYVQLNPNIVIQGTSLSLGTDPTDTSDILKSNGEDA